MRNAYLVCEAFAVVCPYCGEAQVNKNGCEMWTMEDMKEQSHKCQSCEQKFKLSRVKKAHIEG